MRREPPVTIMKDAVRRAISASALAVLLGGCASYAWVNPNVPADVAAADERSCRLEARDLSLEYAVGPYGAPWPYTYPYGRMGWGWPGPYSDPSWQAAAEQRVYERCMVGRGYDLVRVEPQR